ncbi:hypothetical protein DPEC_G00295460 [Dallia pectoralis]|uniref:Uncharacterized protein n=1 Tax=Dallia pectoralis TaxID=75939 RepID=A0ACC2FIP8_DALPE|nr:hypothetical protein DPEC_G00295460 [Dallia pectoralis]
METDSPPVANTAVVLLCLREDVRRKLARGDATVSFDLLLDLAIRRNSLVMVRGHTGDRFFVPPTLAGAAVPMKLGGLASRR